MLDPSKKIEVELALKKDRFEEELRSVAKSGSGLKSLQGRLGKDKTQIEKNILKQRMKLEGPEATKKQQQAAGKALKFEKEKLKLINLQVKETQKLQNEVSRAYKAAASYSGTGFGGGGPTKGGIGGAFRMLGGVAGKAAMALGGAAVGAVSSQVSQGYGQWSQYRQAQGSLVGTGDGPGFRSRMDERVGPGVKRGYGPTETMQQALTAAKATGNAESVTTLQDLTRTIGMDSGAAGGVMGQLTRGGQDFKGKGSSGKRELEKSLAAGLASGLDRARMPEFIQGVGRLVETQGGRQGGDVTSVGFSKILGAMGKTGLSGMEGQRGASVLSQLNESMVKPGGGDYGQALMLQAMGFGKPGGDSSYYEALTKQERGATDPENVRALFAETKTQYGGGEEQILALREMTGLSITQLEGMRKAVDNLDNEGLADAIENAKPIEEQSLTQMQDMGSHIERMAWLDERMVDIGEKSRAGIEGIQNHINSMVDKAIPLAEATLDTTKDMLWVLKAGLDVVMPDETAVDFMNTSEKSVKADANKAFDALNKLGNPGAGVAAFDLATNTINKLHDISQSPQVDPYIQGKAAEEKLPVYDIKSGLGSPERSKAVNALMSQKDLGLNPETEKIRQSIRADIKTKLVTPGRKDETEALQNIPSPLLREIQRKMVGVLDAVGQGVNAQNEGNTNTKGPKVSSRAGPNGLEIVD